MSDPRPRQRLELLAPAGDWDCARAAVENGADAVYFGLHSGFNARARAANFTEDELPGLLAMLHRRGLKGYVALNTLIFTDELARIDETVRMVALAGVDAVMVQDLGLVHLIRHVCPDLPIHASTQMTLTSAESIAVVEELGIERVVLARELSVGEIRKIRQQTDVPLEVFVHGALCVAYSGQCLTSESLGGRSANRGECAQACRLPYELVADGKDVDLGQVKYLLSPQDLAAYDLIPELIDIGVSAVKIEGRLKKPEYVANITRHYREAIDAATAGHPVQFTRREVEEMELSFSRGFSPGWLRGNDHKRLVPGLSSAKRGVLLGQVAAIRGNRVAVDLASSLARGDGVVFEGDRAAGDEQGGRVFGVYRGQERLEQPADSGRVELAFDRQAIDLHRLWIGQQIWKTDDPQLTARLKKTFTSPDPQRRVPLDVLVQAAAGQPLRIVGQTETGATCDVRSAEPLQVARRHPVTEEMLREQLGRLGNTVYALRKVEARIADGPMVPLSVLGQLRHELVRQLDASSVALPPRRLAENSVLERLRAAPPRDERGGQPASPQLRVLCRSLPQLETVLTCSVNGVMVDFLDIRHYRDAVNLARQRGSEIFLATPRIQKPGEIGIFHALQRHGADGILVRNLAGLRFFVERGVVAVADFSLNAANELTVHYLRDQGARRVTVCYDLNRDQLLDLISATSAAQVEVVIHQHIPMFHMEHCVFCAVLSPGTNKTNCGRPCDEHEVRLRDRIGMEHPLTADVGCRNTLFNAVPQSASEVVPSLLAAGVCHFRIELLNEAAEEIRQTIFLYRELLSGRLSGQEIWRDLRAANRVGVTRGTLEERRNPLAIL